MTQSDSKQRYCTACSTAVTIVVSWPPPTPPLGTPELGAAKAG